MKVFLLLFVWIFFKSHLLQYFMDVRIESFTSPIHCEEKEENLLFKTGVQPSTIRKYRSVCVPVCKCV